MHMYVIKYKANKGVVVVVVVVVLRRLVICFAFFKVITTVLSCFPMLCNTETWSLQVS